MRQETIHARAAARIAALGDTPQEIAATLTREGCKGSLLSPNSCPVAVYLKKSGFRSPGVSPSMILLDPDPDESESWNLVRIDTPPPIAEFISLFDRRHFPELESAASDPDE